MMLIFYEKTGASPLRQESRIYRDINRETTIQRKSK